MCFIYCCHWPSSHVNRVSIIAVIFNMDVFDVAFVDYVIIILIVVFLIGSLISFVLLLVDWEAICLSTPTPVEFYLGFV